MTPDEAADLAARTLAAITMVDRCSDADDVDAASTADRERVASDLAGLQACALDRQPGGWTQHLGCERRFAEGLRRTAALYGVTP